MYGGLGQYGDELRRQRRLEAIVVNQMVSPASTFARRQQTSYGALSLDIHLPTTCLGLTSIPSEQLVVF